MTKEELIGRIAKQLYLDWNKDDRFTWDDLPRYRQQAYMFWVQVYVFGLLRQSDYTRLASDQSLPSSRLAVNKSYNDYMLGQEDMLKAGFRKVEL